MTFPNVKIWKCHFFVVSLQRISKEAIKPIRTMKAKWTSLVDDLRGHVDSRHYARHIPGNWEWAAICEKPELSKGTKKKKAALPTAQRFKALMAETKAILHDPERKAEWQAKYDEAMRKARKYNKPILGRLYDYIKHELSKNVETSSCCGQGDVG